jgi:hypothetical protein
MFAGLAWGAGYAESIPNFEFLTVIVFAGGWVVGPAWGAVAGGLAAFLFSAINPYGSGLAVPLVLVSQVIGLALAGFAGGALARRAPPGRVARAALIVAAGVLVTLVYDLLTNVASGLVYGHTGAILLAGIPFAAIHVGTNALLFATVGTALAGALDRTRRSLALGLVVAGALAAAGLAATGPGDACAQAARTSATADTSRADTTRTGAVRADSALALPPPSAASPDSGSAAWAARRDSALARSKAWRETALPSPPRWGEGGAALLRRDDAETASTLTREGGFGERFADDRGSAEPLARFGLPGTSVLVSWLGLPSATVGARGDEIGRVPWPAVGAYEAPRLPVSAREAWRGEGGEAVFTPWPIVPAHPRVTAWVRTGSSGTNRSGFLAAAGNGVLDGTLVVSSQRANGIEPLAQTGDHAIAGQVSWRPGAWTLGAALLSARTGIEDIDLRTERRAGESLKLSGMRHLEQLDLSLEVERSDERLDYARDILEAVSTRGRSDRATLRATRPRESGSAFAAVTLGHERLNSDAQPAIVTNEADLSWLSAGWNGAFGRGYRAEAIVGGGSYGGRSSVAPSLLLERDWNAGMSVWAGAARGLRGGLRGTGEAAPGDTLPDPRLDPSSLWLAAVGATFRTSAERDPRSAHGPLPAGAMRARVALYAGESDPGFDAERFPFAGQAVLEGPFEPTGDPTRFVALTATGRWTFATGLTLDAGGHALGRTVDPALRPSDPEWRAYTTLEGRHVWLDGDLDMRAGVTGEWIGARVGTPAGDFPVATRIGIFAGFMLDEFDVRAEVRDLAGSNRFLPVLDDSGFPLRASERRLLFEARWTFWN